MKGFIGFPDYKASMKPGTGSDAQSGRLCATAAPSFNTPHHGVASELEDAEPPAAAGSVAGLPGCKQQCRPGPLPGCIRYPSVALCRGPERYAELLGLALRDMNAGWLRAIKLALVCRIRLGLIAWPCCRLCS